MAGLSLSLAVCVVGRSLIGSIGKRKAPLPRLAAIIFMRWGNLAPGAMSFAATVADTIGTEITEFA
jgi:hypothetical protein